MSHAAYQYDVSADDVPEADADPDAVPYAISFLRAHPVPRRPRRRGRLVLTLASVAALGGALYGLRLPHEPGPAGPPSPEAAPVRASVQPVALAAPAGVPGARGWLFDPRPVLGTDAYGLADAAPLGPALRPPATAAQAPVEIAQAAMPAAPTPHLAATAAAPMPQQALAQVVHQAVPLPVPRPAELRSPALAALQTPRPVERRALPSTGSVFQAARTEEPSFLETLFGGGPSDGAKGQALAYAGTEGEAIALTPRRRLSAVPNPSEGVAVYDISARTVTLPGGERLEAHSGLGEAMDSPSYVHMRMRGATPPGTYELTEREALFHGVRALRLNPVGGANAVYGRVGLLAHTYMLGPKGASNGCISFRDYNRFLQAYLRGEIRRVVVVAGSGDEPPTIGNFRIGRDRLGMSGRARRSDG